MPKLLQLFVIIPLAGFLISLLIPRKKEKVISWIALLTVGLHMLGFFVFALVWLLEGSPTLDSKHAVLFKTDNIEIFINYYFDKITAGYAFIGGVISFMVVVFSKYYIHREAGFKRFFCTLLLFYSGYNIVIFSGNFETLFVGWELLGITSFLLIAFYRDRYLPVKNGLKVISVYRLSDICLILVMWLSHHLWHENITFIKLGDASLVKEQFAQHGTLAIAICVLLVIVAAAKSAQLPFFTWLPRAMEGPTTSSAVFYGSLAVHIGAFMLLRTYPFWENSLAIKVAIIVIGLATGIIAALIARMQPTVKTQIAYSSIAQIGIIFIEIALGFHILALIHFAGNAFLRTYQLLVSPSVLSYLTHDQFYHFVPGQKQEKSSAFGKLKNSFYILSVKEWNFDFFLYRYLWTPFKWVGKRLEFITHKVSFVLLAVIFLLGLAGFNWQEQVPVELYGILPVIFALIGLLLVLKAFTERGNALRAWILLFISQLFIALAISLNAQVEFQQVFLYLGGTTVSAVVGYICLSKIKAIDNDIELNGFHGYIYERPGIGLIFLLSCLGLLGFPITPTFIGIDLMFTHIREEQIALIIFTALSFLFLELSVLRIYARIFLGQHKKAYHAMAFRSS
jgi:NADH-quinone oxidoreductase subunit L